MKFKYSLTPEYCSETFAATGDRPDSHRVIVVDPIEAGRELREFYEKFKNCGEVNLASQNRELEESDILPILRAADLKIKQIKIEEREREARCEAVRLEDIAFRERLLEQREAKEAADAEAKEARTVEKKRWANEHGSERLTKGLAAGHYCQRLYIEERAEIEFPEFIPDFDANATWGISACPTLEALDLLVSVPNAKIVWIKRRHDYEFDEFDSDDAVSDTGEALLIRNYLDLNVDLIRYML